MDDLAIAIVSGILSGGVSGALIGGLVTLRQQRRAFDHERQSRFIDLKRQRYADLLREADEWLRGLAHQRDVAAAVDHGDAEPQDIPPLLPTTPLDGLAQEIELLAPSDVSDGAGLLVTAIRTLTIYAYDGTAPDWADRAKDLVTVDEAVADYTFRRNRFVRLARGDLGSGPRVQGD
jgi:hypothetical protein